VGQNVPFVTGSFTSTCTGDGAQNPFQTIFPETKQLADLQASALNESFVSVKVGDVNGNAVTSSLMTVNDRTDGTLLFDVQDRSVKAGETFTVKYDPDDLEYIALYQDGAHIATARKKYQFAMAVADLNEGEGEIVHKALESRREYWQVLEERREDIDADMRTMGFEAINFRLIHKHALNRMEGEALDNLLEAAAVIPTKTKEKPVRVRLYDDSDADGSIIS
jgi:hypothetical protein